MSFCFPQLSFAQVLSHKTTSITPTQNSIQSTTVTTELTQVINHNTTESGSPVIQATGADITINLGINSQLYAQGPAGDDYRAVDITIEHTEASKALGINPQLVLNSSGTLEGLRVNTASDFFETVATPVTIHVKGGKVFNQQTAIFVNQLRSSEDSATTINIDNAEVYNTSTNGAYPVIAVYGTQQSPDLVSVNIGPNAFIHSPVGNAFTTIGVATINNEGTIHGNIRIDNIGLVNNYGTWLTGGNNNGFNDSNATEIINVGTMGLLPFNKASNVTYTGNIHNYSLLKLSNGFAGDRVTINGNLISENGSAISLDVHLGADDSAKDKLIITGDTSGQTQVFIKNTGGNGGKTVNGIQIIQVQRFSDGQFTLGAPVQAGNYEYFLHKGGNHFYLVSILSDNHLKPDQNTNSGSTSSHNLSSNLLKAALVLRPAVTAFSMAPAVNFQSNSQMLGTTYSRAQAQSHAKNAFQAVWAQTGFAKQDFVTHAQSSSNPFLATTQLKSQQDTSFLQLGSEIWNAHNAQNQSTQVLQLMAGMSQTKAQISNPDRAKAGLNSMTAELASTEHNIGLEYQYRFENGSYVSAMAHVGQLSNSYTDVYGGSAKQKGNTLNVSFETSKPYQVANWTLEPQAQIVFQQLKLNGFEDAISRIESHTTHNTRLRAGVRLSQQNSILKGSEIFTQIDLLQDHQANRGVTISRENINAKLDSQPWLGITLGGSYRTGPTQLKAQVGYEKSLTRHAGNDGNGGNGRNGFNAHLAFHYSF